MKVCPTVIPKYSLISQKPPSFTCEKISEPEPVASTSNSGLTCTPLAAAIGATMPHAVVIATVAEPVARRISAATSQPNSSGDRCTAVATLTISFEMPLSISTRPKPPPAPTISVMPAIGARQSPQNFWICSRLKPRLAPKVQKLTSTAISNATSELPTKRSRSFGKRLRRGDQIGPAADQHQNHRQQDREQRDAEARQFALRRSPRSAAPFFASCRCRRHCRGIARRARFLSAA